MKIGTKLLIAFLVVGVIPFAAIGAAALIKASDALEKQAFAQLESLRDVKKNQILRYFKTINDQIITFSENRMIIEAMRQFDKAFDDFNSENQISANLLQSMRQELLSYYTKDFSEEYIKQNAENFPDVEKRFGQLDAESIALQYYYIKVNQHPLGFKDLFDRAPDASTYSRLHATYHSTIRSYLKKFGYYDIFLVDPKTGDIVYSVFKELDYTTSLIDGPYAQTNLGEAFRRANAATDKDAVIMIDFAQYFPSYEAPAGFVASPIFDGADKIGVAIFQFPIDTLNAIMFERTGMGKSGETYLVGSDKLMRSDTYLDPINRSVVASFKHPQKGRVDTEACRAALAGQKGQKIVIDYFGNSVLSAYTPVKMGDTNWALLAEIDKAEAFAAVKNLKQMTGLVAVAAMLLILIASFVLTGYIAKPITAFAKKAVYISEHRDLNQRIEVQSRDEVGMLASAFNTMINSLKNYYDELRRLNLELEQRVMERTADLEATNKELEAFSYSVSHDLRAPLRVINGYGQALLEDYDDQIDAEGRNFLERMRQATQHMGEMIDNLLQLSMVTRIEIKPETVNLSAVVREIIDGLIEQEGERDTEVLIEGNLTAKGDRGLLRLLLENLVGNAWKFTSGKKKARIEFGAERSGDRFEYLIRDNGAGFDMAYADKLFKPFNRLHSTEEFKGTGIGLASVYRIIKRHGGKIRAEGKLGQGAVFRFTL